MSVAREGSQDFRGHESTLARGMIWNWKVFSAHAPRWWFYIGSSLLGWEALARVMAVVAT